MGTEHSGVTVRVERFYVVVRADLSPAQQAVQAVHAATAYAEKHGGVGHLPLALLSARNEAQLSALRWRAFDHDVPFVEFREPDLDDQLTAVAFHPSMGRKLKNQPLALSA